MKTNAYLYGEDVEVPEIPQEIVAKRIEALNDNLEKLQNVHYLERDMERIRAVIKAIRFWLNIDYNE